MDDELPELFEGAFDDEGLLAFGRDLAGAASHLEVRTKAVALSMQSGDDGLDQAFGALRDGRITAVQLRYAHEGRRFVDTLMREEPGRYRLVRMPEPQTSRCEVKEKGDPS